MKYIEKYNNEEDLVELYIRSLEEHDLSDEEERIYLEKIKAGDEEAKNEFIEKNLRLVLKNAKFYTKKGLELLDLIQEGNIGLIYAVNKFDLNYKNKFSTYATFWIKQAMSRAIADKANAIRKPVHFNESVSKIKKMEIYLTKRDGETPSKEKLSKVLRISEKKLDEILATDQLTNITSLNIAINSDKNESSKNVDELEDFIDNNEPSLTDVVENEEMVALVNKAMKTTLNERELKIIKLRFGFNNQEPKTLEEVGKEFGLTRERIRQLEVKALKKLKTGKNKVLLNEYNPNYKK